MSSDKVRHQVEARVKEEAAAKKAERKEPLSENFVLECLRANRVGDALLYNTLHRGKFVYVKKWGRWLYWAGHHWAEDIMGLTFMAVESVCEEYLRVSAILNKRADESTGDTKKGIEAQREALAKRVNLLRDVSGRDKLLECAHTIRDPLAISGDELDQQPYLLAFSNGVVDLRTGDFRDGRPEDYILNAAPIEWAGIDAPCPTWEQYLLACHELCPDGPEAMVNFLRRALGYGIMADRRDHVFLVFWGDKGRNGKDTCMKVVSEVLGPALSNTVPVEMLLASNQQRSSSSGSPDIMALRGMRMAWSSEPDKVVQFAVGKLKALTGGGTLTARGLYDKMMSSWKPTHLLILMTNDVPGARSEDTAFWSRMLIIQWRMRFVDNPQDEDERPQDKDLFQKLMQELPGIAAWLVRGCLEYLRDGLQPPPSVRADTKAKQLENDIVGQFLEESCEMEEVPEGQEPTWRIPGGELYDAFCIHTRNWRFGSRNFGMAMTKKVAKKKSGSNVYLGIRLNAAMLEEIEKHRAKGKKSEDDDGEEKEQKPKRLF